MDDINLPPEYLDETYGIRPEKNRASFNNILYLLEYLLAIKKQGKLTKKHLDWWKAHWELNKDENGLYKPKNSKDNLYAKIMGDLLLLGHSEIPLKSVLKHIDRFTDLMLWTVALGSRKLNMALSPLLLFIVVPVIYSFAKKHKIRPKIHERILWTLQGKKYSLTYHQNDGKILYSIALQALESKSLFLKGLRKIGEFILKKRYGEKYFQILMNNYFIEEEHPIRIEWSKV